MHILIVCKCGRGYAFGMWNRNDT